MNSAPPPPDKHVVNVGESNDGGGDGLPGSRGVEARTRVQRDVAAPARPRLAVVGLRNDCAVTRVEGAPGRGPKAGAPEGPPRCSHLCGYRVTAAAAAVLRHAVLRPAIEESENDHRTIGSDDCLRVVRERLHDDALHARQGTELVLPSRPRNACAQRTWRCHGPSGDVAVACTTCELRCHEPRPHSLAISATNMFRVPVLGSAMTLAPQLVQFVSTPDGPPVADSRAEPRACVVAEKDTPRSP